MQDQYFLSKEIIKGQSNQNIN